MARREAQIITCDRCDLEIEIGITDYPIPMKWLNIQEFGILCPRCAKKFREFATEFFEDSVPKDWDIDRNLGL